MKSTEAHKGCYCKYFSLKSIFISARLINFCKVKLYFRKDKWYFHEATLYSHKVYVIFAWLYHFHKVYLISKIYIDNFAEINETLWK